ncbi:SDR family oxidoreductase [Pendulispora albinea]|uniref:SDR family oxidoreductase n=1 Tax=Pendulispora albinea TaxID=2741071 RepID=A0ABZ2LWH7_9BACT
MTASSNLLITGANGIVGSELVRSLLHAPDGAHLYLLIRGDTSEVAAKERWIRAWASTAKNGVKTADLDRVHVVPGDVTRADFGLAPHALGSLTETITGIVHSAASTSFQQSPEQADRINVVGTRHALAFAKRCRRLDRFGLVSTVYVAGQRTGTILEDTLDLGCGHVNEYERSKAVAEEEAGRAGLPLSIYRLGVVVGRREDGRVARMSGIYPVFRILYQGLLSMVPGDPAQIVDIIPVDDACDAIAYLFGQAFEPGARYHVCAGAERSLSLGELLPAFEEAVCQVEPRWRLRGYPRAAYVTSEAFSCFMETIDRVAHLGLRGVVRQLRVFTRQLEYPKVFDRTRLERDLAPSGLHLPHVREWLPTLAAHGVACGFSEPGWEAMLDG